jgi:hypothetical protein
VCSNYHRISAWEGCYLDIGFGESYLDIRSLGSHDWTLDRYMVNMAIMLLLLSLVFKIQIGASSDGVYGSEGWKIGCLLGRLLVLLWRWRWITWLYFWLSCMGTCHGIHYLHGCRRIGDCWLWCVDLICMCSIIVWLVVLRRVSMVI